MSMCKPLWAKLLQGSELMSVCRPIDTNKSDLHADADNAHTQHATNGTNTSSTTVPRPRLQKDGLEPIDLFSGQEAYAPHVSLLYNNASYSLFRPSSSPSGDHENVLLGDEEAGDHDLYFASLDNFIQSLHETLPDLSGDGENEIILDFGPLDMQVSEVSRVPFCPDTPRLTSSYRTTCMRASYRCLTLIGSVSGCASQSWTDCL